MGRMLNNLTRNDKWVIRISLIQDNGALEKVLKDNPSNINVKKTIINNKKIINKLKD